MPPKTRRSAVSARVQPNERPPCHVRRAGAAGPRGFGDDAGSARERVGASPMAIYHWEIGRTHPHHDAYPRLAEALQTTIDYLMTGRVR